MCHPDKAFTSDKLRCVFNEYKATVWVLPRLCCLSCAPLPEGNLREQGGEVSREEGRWGKEQRGVPGGCFSLSLSPFPNDSEVDKTRRSEDVTCYLSLLLAGRENLHLKISRGRKRNLPFVVWVRRKHQSWPGRYLPSPLLSRQDSPRWDYRRALSLIGFSFASLNRFKETR